MVVDTVPLPRKTALVSRGQFFDNLKKSKWHLIAFSRKCLVLTARFVVLYVLVLVAYCEKIIVSVFV